MPEAPTKSDREGGLPVIRVLIADDSVIVRSALTRMLRPSPRIQLCGFAANGVEAVEKAKALRPDVITLDVLMPVLDGLGALRQIMREQPCPVIMLSSLTQRGAEVTLEALSAGAFDYIAKEELFHAESPLAVQQLLSDRIEAAAKSPLCARREKFRSITNAIPAARTRAVSSGASNVVPEIIAMGASTGGPKALEQILTALPGNLPVPIVVVQHMPPGFIDALAGRLDSLCELRVRETHQGERIQAGTVYLAPAGKQMTVFRAGRDATNVCLSDSPADTLHKPSVDVLMLSVAEVFGAKAVGVILTGMGSDGVKGMTAISNAGGITLGQDEATSAVYGMPRVCAEQGVLQKILPLGGIAEELLAAFPQPIACGKAHATAAGEFAPR